MSSKKQNVNQLQEIINKKLLAMIDMKDFIIKDDVSVYKKNTFGVKCPNCKSDNIYAMTIQTRSSDEASDRFYMCLDCGYKWKVSGSS